ncbi:feruloyl-CoA synthase [Psychrobacter aquimaris]|uniref:feruloyl-CoA synthase n=1 Tax=Psychrobacter aquimaris TaxID=292733 RepID=UPI0018E0552E|nr:feruloyl-CoA synthase [Psychrobacter aquimaris]
MTQFTYHSYPERAVAVGSSDAVVHQKYDSEGDIHYINATTPLDDYPDFLFDKLYDYAKKYPDRVLIAQRELNVATNERGDWVKLTYSDVLKKARSIAQALLEYDLSEERPLMILSENSIEVFLLMCGAMLANVPYALVVPAYSLVAKKPDKLQYVIEKLTPALFYAGDGKGFLRQLKACGQMDKPIITSTGNIDGEPCLNLNDLLATEATDAVEQTHKQMSADSIAKFLFTSGSTGNPKVVPTTHRMLCSNQQMLKQGLCLIEEDPLVLIDWLSWHHTFGGSHNLGIALYNGGTFYIDDGRPVAGKFDETIRNLKEISPSKYFNVPVGWSMLANALEEDEALRDNFFKKVDLYFFGGASLSAELWQQLGDISYQHCGERIRIMSGIGMTETSPSCTFTTGLSNDTASFVGVPAAGVEIKLVPMKDKIELRIKGPHVMPGYWRHDTATSKAADSFDDEGFYCSGDGVLPYNPNDLSEGLVYDGRIAEDFKLTTGTFVNVGELRNRMVLQGMDLIEDVVLTGEGKSEIGAFVFVKEKVARKLTELHDTELKQVLEHDRLQAWFSHFMSTINDGYEASSKIIARIYLMETPPNVVEGEKTDKGTLNQRKLRNNRVKETDKLYEDKADKLRFLAK